MSWRQAERCSSTPTPQELAAGVGPSHHQQACHALDRVGVISLRQERLRKSDHLNPLADMADFRRVAAEAGFRVARICYYTPLVGGVVENVLVRVAEGGLSRQSARSIQK